MSSDVQAVIDFYGPVDLLGDRRPSSTPIRCASNRVERWASSTRRSSNCSDPPPPTSRISPAAANPITYLTEGRQVPPFLILHGDHDCIVPYQASVQLDRRDHRLRR